MSAKKKDVLFLCQYFYPEYVSSATLPFDTAIALVKAGYRVGVLCGYPKEFCSIQAVPLRETYMGVDIRRLRYLQLRRRSVVGRLVNYFSFVLAVLLHFFELSKYRAVIVYSNPPILPLAAAMANVCFGTRVVFVSYDVYPEIAIATNTISDGSFIATVMRLVNRFLLGRVTKVVAISDEMRRFLLDNRPALTEDQVEVICNWHHGDTELGGTNTHGSTTVSQLKSDGDFVVSYIGNMGICQELDTIVDAIRQLRDEPHIKFLVAGLGSGMEVLRRAIAPEGLHNVTILGFLGGQDLEVALAASDCFVLSLAKGLTGLCFPSKLYSYMMAGRPIIAIVDRHSSLAKEIMDSELGLTVEIGDSRRLADSVRLLMANESKRLRMGANCRAVYEERYDRLIGTAKYVSMVAEVLGV